MDGKVDVSHATSLEAQDHTRETSKSVERPIQDDPAPVLAIRDLASEVNPEVEKEPGSQVNGFAAEGLLTAEEIAHLLPIFRRHYGRWIRWDEDSAHMKSTESSLLTCACCLIAVRHTSLDAATRVASQLYECSKRHLGTDLLTSPQPIEFFQASLILSMWSTTVGGKPYSLDSWLLTGFALQHAQSCSLFNHVLSRTTPETVSKRQLDAWCVWNHLCLVHLHYCVGTRRKALIGSFDIQRCRGLLKFDDASNFEVRMVAETLLYWTIYEHCLGANVDLPKTQAALFTWKQEWEYMFQQPRSQFLQMGFHFAQLLAYERALKSRSARVREALLSEMVRLCAKIMELAMDTEDERTQHLSDHIYHMITFAAVTLSRLLSAYDEQLERMHDIAQLDALIWKLAEWLGKFGLPCHATHTLGNIVSAVQTKLRPQTVPQLELPLDLADWPNDGPVGLPDLLDTQLSPGGHWDFLPDWEPFYQGPLT